MRKGRWVFAGAMALVIGFGISSYFSKVEAAPCRCPLIYAPVICDHDRTYPNPCVANCHNAKNCVPTGGL
ncbi:MAG TPA: hypothetical protein VFB67_09120 [Candidatus Polarisedimenticolaceae bacterium]|nr:hypothetical protein [Candidatus Polarisedimenticolaceae bacterium]